MVRGMKVLFYFVAFLLCFVPKISNADSGKSVESKRKFISISNKGKDDAVIECKSEKQNFNKTLKAGEKMRWGLVGETAPTTICEVDVGSKGVHGYLPAFVEKECKRECKWRVLDDGGLKLKGADGEWKSFELKADEEGARNYDEHHWCDDDDDEDEDDVGKGKGKGKRGSGDQSRSLEPAASEMISQEPAGAPSPDEGMARVMSEKRKSRKRGARLAPSPAKSKKKKKKSRARGRRKMKPRHPRSPAPALAKTPTTKTWKKKPRAPVAPPPMKHAQGIPTLLSTNNYSPAPAPIPLASTKFTNTKKAAPPMKQGRRKLKPRHPRSPVPVKPPALVPENNKNKSYTLDKSTPRILPSPAPAPTTIWKAPSSPTKQIMKAQPPKKQGGRRKLKPRHPRAEAASAPAPTPAPTIAISPTKEIMKPSENAPTPTTHAKSTHGNFPNWKAPAPADWSAPPDPENGKQTSQAPAPAPTQGREQSEAEGPDAELSPLPLPGSTFYTCIKEDSR